MTLAQKKCTPCERGAVPLTQSEAEDLRTNIPEWRLLEENWAISRKFTFSNFVDALAFVNKVGALAEEQGHHPDIAFGWGYADIMVQTHKINGLHENDFILAAKIDTL